MQNKRYITVIVSIILTAVLLCSTLICAFGDGTGSTIDSKKLTSFEDKLNMQIPNLLKKYKVPGAAVGLIHEGQVEWIQGYGLSDKGNSRPVGAETVFQAASLSKVFTAWGVMKLAEQGKLELDAPVEKYLTRWHLPQSKYSQLVTIKMLLNHTAGLSGVSYKGYSQGQKLPTLEQSLAGVNIVREPGYAFSYTGADYTLLQLVIEEVTGQAFSQYMKNEILLPLGLKGSSFEWNEAVEDKASRGHGPIANALPDYQYIEKAAAGLYTTASDLAAFAAAAMEGANGELAGRGVISEVALTKMLTRTKTKTKIGEAPYGLGYYILKLPNGQNLIAHDGTNRGFCTQLLMFPEKGEGLIILTNGDMGTQLIREIWGWWLEMQTGSDQGYRRGIKAQESKMIAVALGLLTALLFYIEQFIVGLRSGKRSWSLHLSFGRILRTLLLLAVAGGLYFACYTPWYDGGWYVLPYLPTGFGWVSLTLAVWIIVLLVGGLFPTRKRALKEA